MANSISNELLDVLIGGTFTLPSGGVSLTVESIDTSYEMQLVDKDQKIYNMPLSVLLAQVKSGRATFKKPDEPLKREKVLMGVSYLDPRIKDYWYRRVHPPKVEH